MRSILIFFVLWSIFLVSAPIAGVASNPLRDLSVPPDFESHRVSSFDRSGGNQDWISIEPGETKVLADIQGPGAITHIWNTIDAEKYYSRMLILRFYWDDQEIPSVEVPLGDFFAVGHGLNRPFESAPVNASSEGRARNCYWYMPFQKSAKVTVTHEGFLKAGRFYYYIDYQKFDSLPEDLLYFHSQYRQATPNPSIELNQKNLDGLTNYVLLETAGKGKYVGSVVSIQTNKDGWFGEGDDMFFVDGAEKPRLTGTGTEDYFNDAWGFRPFSYPYHGVTLWEGYKKGDRGTCYKWHLFDPVAFQSSLKATIEHGHANDRQDDWYSTAFWYQNLPSPQPPLLPAVYDRLPDEGQLYAKRLFLNKELALRIQQEQYQDALERIDEFVAENENADRYGYWSLRKGMLLKHLGEDRKAEEILSEAVKRSDSQEERALERDAGDIHKIAQREYNVIEQGREVWVYAACADSYELYIDGQSVAKGQGWDSIDELKLDLSRGRHVVTARAESSGSKAGFLLQISHRSGYEITDSSWRVCAKEYEDSGRLQFDDSNWSDAEIMGVPGVSNWLGDWEGFNFMSGLILAKYIWMPEDVVEYKTVYFRKVIQVR
ncbi:MAG: DUF2961 domain-containing protein [Candidatus Omnitrophica bacterium]|nr:DUF2961 domain-containing protein [Candidatus Omnitrophota bacterium]